MSKEDIDLKNYYKTMFEDHQRLMAAKKIEIAKLDLLSNSVDECISELNYINEELFNLRGVIIGYFTNSIENEDRMQNIFDILGTIYTSERVWKQPWKNI